MGFDSLFSISSSHGLGMGELLDEVYKYFPDENQSLDELGAIKVAVIGKPNVGKSSLINRVLGEERVIVSEVAGTTRDAIDTFVEDNGKKYMFIDTAGIRRKSRINENIEKYSIIRALTAIERADVCLILIDATEGVTEQDTKIAGFAHEQGKASIVVVNKWDLLDKVTGTLEDYKKSVHQKLGFMSYVPILFISAKSGQRVNTIFEMIEHVASQSKLRISTGMLNDVLNEATALVQPPSDKGKPLKVYYITQSGINPPTFVVFINKIDLMHYSYQRYIENQLRKTFGFEGVPIKFILKEKKKE
jgi:GTP-binding protein